MEKVQLTSGTVYFLGANKKQQDVEMRPVSLWRSSALYANDRCVCILSRRHFYLLMEI